MQTSRQFILFPCSRWRPSDNDGAGVTGSGSGPCSGSASGSSGSASASASRDEEPVSEDDSLVIYRGRNEELAEPLIEGFGEVSGYDVSVRYGSSAEMGAALLEWPAGTTAHVEDAAGTRIIGDAVAYPGGVAS